MSLTLLHNPRCSKSRATKALLDERGVDFETRLYLEHPPTTDELARIIAMLGYASARQLMRTGEAAYKELGLADVDDEEALLVAMSEHPKLIQRPVLIHGERAAVGRPPEAVLDIL